MATPSRDEIKVLREQAQLTEEERAAMIARFDELGRKLASVSDDELCEALEEASEEDGPRKRLLRNADVPTND